MLDTVESLLDNQKKISETSYALGIYTFAIEEFGKGLSLQRLYQQGKAKIQIPSWIFKDHDKKIKRAFKVLPEPCRKFTVGFEIDKANSGKKKLKMKDGGGVSVTGKMTGLFMFDNNVDLEVRLKCFFVGWNKERKEWEYELTTSKDNLENAVSRFKTELTKHRN